jgi:hypothetical protein
MEFPRYERSTSSERKLFLTAIVIMIPLMLLTGEMHLRLMESKWVPYYALVKRTEVTNL